MREILTGGCQCGAVRYRFEGPAPAAYACHCGECKKQTASAFSMSIPMHYDDLHVEVLPSSFETIAHSGKTKHNYFCGKCGTRLWHSGSNPPDKITLKVGTLDDPSGIAPQGHLWVSRKQPGIELDPASDQQLTQPDDLEAWRANLGIRECR
ncbi:hypothetical protein A8B75_02680 [Sphingomonadales bacterium EhC05]|jgi:hypothetical protein|uniref:GFA family protein n=1 Tax=Parasphingorhabdus sp. TaxID=2709688 RepID=UPI0007F40987|nr:hypothetical protein A8B75_02680 [Sphingomonadales bacterium EhC05]